MVKTLVHINIFRDFARELKRIFKSGAQLKRNFKMSRISNFIKIQFSPHRYYSRACRRQKGSTSHLGITSGLCGSTDLAKNVSLGRRNPARIDDVQVFDDFRNLSNFRRNPVSGAAPATDKPRPSRLAWAYLQPQKVGGVKL